MCSQSHAPDIVCLQVVDLVAKENVEKWLKYLRNEFPTIPFKSSTQLQSDRLVIPAGFIFTMSSPETILRKRRLNVLTTLYQNACLLVLSFPGSFVNKNAIKHKIKVSVLLCRPRL